jgi:hypothetical protein
MLGLTSIELPFRGNLRSIWVDVIGLELLSLACPGLDLGSVMLHYICHPCYCYGYADPIRVENRNWVTGMEFVGVMPTVQGFVRCDAGSLWIVIIPNLRTGSWSDHP